MYLPGKTKTLTEYNSTRTCDFISIPMKLASETDGIVYTFHLEYFQMVHIMINFGGIYEMFNKISYDL